MSIIMDDISLILEPKMGLEPTTCSLRIHNVLIFSVLQVKFSICEKSAPN